MLTTIVQLAPAPIAPAVVPARFTSAPVRAPLPLRFAPSPLRLAPAPIQARPAPQPIQAKSLYISHNELTLLGVIQQLRGPNVDQF